MKKLFFQSLILIINFLLLVFSCTAQTTSWAWAKKGIATLGSDQAEAVTTDANGNVYVVGYFLSSSITFDSYILNNPIPGDHRMFLAKYDSLGNVLWAKTSDTGGNEEATDVITDASGNVYVTGIFFGDSIRFGSATLFNSTAPHMDNFLVKYNASGNVLWARSTGGSLSEFSSAIAANTSGDIYITGTFDSPVIVFGADTLTNANAGNPRLFLTKYNSSGNVVWAKTAEGGDYNFTRDVATDASGNVYITGGLKGSTHIFGSYTLSGVGDSDILLAKYNTSGNVLWAKSVGGSAFESGNAVCTDALGNAYITGYYQSSSLIFGSNMLSNTGIGNAVYLVKCNAGGTALWAKSVGGNSYSAGRSVTTDVSGNVYFTGQAGDSLIVFGSDTLPSIGDSDIFLVKLDPMGNELWARREGGPGNDGPNSVVVNGSRNLYLAGWFSSPSITFGSTTLNGTAGMDFDMFIAKLSMSCNISQATVTITGSTLTANLSNAGYQWIDCNNGNMPINGEINQSFTATVSGNYAVIITENGCSSTSACSNIIISGISGSQQAPGLSIFPSPNNGSFTISGSGAEKLMLVNTMGQVIQTIELSASNNNTAILSGIESGIYFITGSDPALKHRIVVVK